MRMNCWYIIHNKHGQEDSVKNYLTMKGLEVFNPLIEAFSPKEGKIDKELKVLKCFSTTSAAKILRRL